jgi:hypothetical protein
MRLGLYWATRDWCRPGGHRERLDRRVSQILRDSASQEATKRPRQLMSRPSWRSGWYLHYSPALRRPISHRTVKARSIPPPWSVEGVRRLLCRDGQRRAESAGAAVRLSDGLLQRLPPNQKPTMLVETYGRKASVQHEGECDDESSRSRSSRLDAFSRCCISPGGVPQLRPRTLWLRLHGYGSALRLCRSSLVGTGPHGAAWVRATDLRTTTLRTDSCLPSAAGGARLLHNAVSRGSAAVL